MPAQLKRGLARILAARQGLLDARAARTETLQRFRSYARAQLGDFVTNVDPISGMRIIELNAEGNKATGEMTIVLAFFEGTRLRIGVDSLGGLSAESTPADALPPIGRVLDLDVPADFSRAVLVYEPAGAPAGTERRLDLAEVLVRLVDNAAHQVEETLRGASHTTRPAPPPTATATVTPLHPPKPPGLSYSVG